MLSFECIKNEKSVYFLLTSAKCSQNGNLLGGYGHMERIFPQKSKRRVGFGREAMEDFHTPNTYQKSQKIGQITRKISDRETCRGQR